MSKADDLQSHLNHLEYFKRKAAALRYSIEIQKRELAICEKAEKKYKDRVEKLEAACKKK